MSDAPAVPDQITMQAKDMADEVAAYVIHHIDTMYPELWKGAPKTARISIRNYTRLEVRGRVENALRDTVDARRDLDKARMRAGHDYAHGHILKVWTIERFMDGDVSGFDIKPDDPLIQKCSFGVLP